MATVAAPERIEALEAPVRRTPKRSWKNLILPAYTKLIIAYLLVPIAVMILYSFNANTAANATAPKVSFRWQGFTLDWWRQWNGVPDLTSALWNSLLIAVISTSVATIFGTMIALALVRYRFRGSGTLEVVMFNIAFVAIVVRARLSGFNREIEEAAQDLYADAVQTFIKVTLPLIWPGILAGGLLAFALSIDDFVTTNFVAGQTVTFPLWVYGAVKVGIPPQVFVMGTAIFLAGVVIAIANVGSSRRKGRTMVRAETEDSA